MKLQASRTTQSFHALQRTILTLLQDSRKRICIGLRLLQAVQNEFRIVGGIGNSHHYSRGAQKIILIDLRHRQDFVPSAPVTGSCAYTDYSQPCDMYDYSVRSLLLLLYNLAVCIPGFGPKCLSSVTLKRRRTEDRPGRCC